MPPRNAAASVSTHSAASPTFTEDVPPSIEVDVVSLDDPSKMSPLAIRAELAIRGVDVASTADKRHLEKTLVLARKNSGGAKRRGEGSSPLGRDGLGDHQQQQYQHKRQRPSPTQKPQDHLQQTVAKVPGMRVTPPNTEGFERHRRGPGSHNAYSGSGSNPTHIPLIGNNRIPPQILNIIRTSADPSMRAINLDHRNLGDREVMKLTEALERNRTVESLSLRNCSITDKGAGRVGDMLGRNTTLVELNLDGNAISTEGAAKLGTALIRNKTLAVLTLNQNGGIMDKGVVYLIGALEHNTTLKNLEVNGCGAVGVSRLERIESLLADRQIDSNFESLLERLLDDDFRVTGIDLSGRRIGDKGAARLAEALADNTQVRQLWLRGCNVGNVGAKAIASCLEQNMAIVDLFLGNNNIGDAGLVAISDALASSNLTLVSLELDDNRLGESGIDAFSQALEKNTSVLVASFDNNPIGNSGKMEMLQASLTEKRNGLNLVSFVVDPDAGSTNSAADGNMSGVVNMSVCSSYMPSTYRRAGFSSQAGGPGAGLNSSKLRNSGNSGRMPNTTNLRNSSNSRKNGSSLRNSDLRDSGTRSTLRGSSESHKFSVYNRDYRGDKSVQKENPETTLPAPPPAPPPPPLKPISPPMQQEVPTPFSASSATSALSPTQATSPIAQNSASAKSGSAKSTKSGSTRSAKTPQGQIAPKLQASSETRQHTAPKRIAKPKARPPSPPPYAKSNPYQQAHVPVPLKAQALETITERSVGTWSTLSDSHGGGVPSGGVSGRSRVSSIQRGTSVVRSISHIRPKDTQDSESPLVLIVDEDDATPVMKKRNKAASTDITELGNTTVTESIAHPQTQRNFNTTLKKLWRRVEMMKRANRLTSVHYGARHFWFWSVPISSSSGLAVLLSLGGAADVSGGSRLGLSLASASFALLALGLNFLQARRGRIGRADVHRSAEHELGQVAFRLDTLGKYDGRGLTTGSHSTRSRANAIRDLYRIDVYLQAMQRCTPPVPESINGVFYLLASRLKEICQKYPNAVRVRSTYAFYEDDLDGADGPVPVEMQIDALDLLGKEIENYFLYPLFMPNANDVVSRTIDIFFARPEEGGGGMHANEGNDDSYVDEDEYGYGDGSMASSDLHQYEEDEVEIT